MITHFDRSLEPELKVRLMDKLEGYMDKKGLRSTSQRRLIVELFFATRDHITIEELYGEVRKKDKGVGYATVYRTLKLLAESGVASERKFEDGLSRYELCDDASTHHDHIICKDCDRIFEFEEPEIERLQEAVAKVHGFKITSHKLELYAECTKAECEHRN